MYTQKSLDRYAGSVVSARWLMVVDGYIRFISCGTEAITCSETVAIALKLLSSHTSKQRYISPFWAYPMDLSERIR